MTKSETILALIAQKLVVVIRGETAQEAIKASQACIEGGIRVVEIAYTNTKASEVINHLKEAYAQNREILIGAGTVLDAQTARLAILSGAQFIVSPSFNDETARMCNRYAIPYIPGCMTISEVTRALEAGSEMVKVFPGGNLGPSFIASLKAPLSHVQVMVTGGVNQHNMTEWFAAGACALGIGGDFNKLAAQGQFDSITEIAKTYHQILNEAH
ncbi:bifunctional 4-hydroxy-2-oxoglutarate aldolase/2-dehydro-3-deoxy-phosphogluconate aldolase [Streptococcus iniae]|nr:bifunctional 4-hydroxy-2-oxoglutarate aldolase/2-dehydro-3-deoxy-phosphogluconate aldolase [Streptococcus iniae]